jgi:hypothetical protein
MKAAFVVLGAAAIAVVLFFLFRPEGDTRRRRPRGPRR